MSGKSRASSAQSRVEDLMMTESRLSSVDKPPIHEDESRGQYAWRLLRQSIRFAIDSSVKDDATDLSVTHGVHQGRSMVHPNPIISMLFNRCTKEYVTYDGKEVRTFEHDGRRKEIIKPQGDFTRLLCAPQLKLFVGYTVNDDKLTLMNSAFEVNSTSLALGPILCAVFNENLGDVVTVGPGFMTTSVFRYGGRHILPRRTTHEGMAADDQYSMIVLEETASRSQRAYISSATTVAVYNLYEGTLLSRKKDLHTRAITALTFFNPLKYIITGAKDGSIKIWDERWHLQVVFVGHAESVTSLTVYPFGPNFMSASLDKSLRVWSLETCDQVIKVDVEEPVEFIGSMVNTDLVYSYGNNKVHLWNVNHIHTLHTRVGHRTQLVKTTDHPEYPIRSVLLCRDASVRILCPSTGHVITTLLMEPRKMLMDAAYAIAQDNLFAVFGNGDIFKCDTTTNPCTVQSVWPCSDPKKACNYLLVYEYVITAEISGDVWAGMKRAAATKGFGQPMGGDGSANRTLLLGGRRDGHICVFDWETGDIEFEIEAHGTKGVLSMIANSKADQLISAGLDNIIKIWRLYPYAQESLAPLMSFYCAHTPIYMSVMRNKLAVAFQEHTTATYSVVMYNIRAKGDEHDRDRLDHSPDDDHYDSITGLTSCQKMKLLASCSADSTIRIWNEDNQLVRLIQLNAVPYSLCFCSDKGDLLVGIGKHVHKIEYKKYIPQSYKFKMMSARFRDPVDEKPIAFDEGLLKNMHREDVKRLKAAYSSFKFTHFIDILTDEENDEVMKEKREREQAFAILDKREAELLKIKEGELQAKHKPKPTEATKGEAFNKYLKIFFNRPKVELQDRDPYEVDQAGLDPPVEEEEPYRPDREPTGFFPAPSTARKLAPPTPEPPQKLLPLPPPPDKSATPNPESSQMLLPPLPPTVVSTTPDETPKHMASPIRVGGFIPNSVLVHLLFPERTISSRGEESDKDVPYRPPAMSEAQLAQIKSHKKFGSSDSFVDRTLIMDYDDPEENKEDIQEEETETEPEMPSGQSTFMSKFQDIMARDPTPAPEGAEEETQSIGGARSPGGSDVPGRQSASPAAAATTAATKSKLRGINMKPKKIITFVAPRPPPIPKPEPVFLTEAPTPIPTRMRSPSPPPTPPQTPLPTFITQFEGSAWFDKYFPNCNENTMPKPWSVAAFVTMLARILRIAEYEDKVPVVRALHLLHKEEGLPNVEVVTKVVYSVFDHFEHPPSCLHQEEKDFIIHSLELLHTLGVYDLQFYTKLMINFIDGDKTVRSQVEEILKSCGLCDPHQYFRKELDSWDVWNIAEHDRTRELNSICVAWLEKWMTTFKMHITDSIDRMKKGEGLHGRLNANQMKNTPSKSILRKNQDNVDDPTKLEGVEMVPGHSPSKMVTVTFDEPPDNDSVTYMEVLNYFCEMELERQADRMRAGGLDRSGQDGAVKNTVLVLPKITGKGALVRLGETHTSKCRSNRETSLEADLRLPPMTQRGRQPAPGQLYGFPPCINLPMKQVIMNPFPHPLDDLDPALQQPILITLKTSQKFFVPSRSYVPLDTY